MKTSLPKKTLRLVILSLAALGILAGSYVHIMDSYELQTLDLRFRLRPQRPTTDKIAIIEIGDDTVTKIGRFPFDRSYHALLVKALSDSGAKAIVFDLFFSEPSSSDAEFTDAVKKAGNVYFPLFFPIDYKNLLGQPKARDADDIHDRLPEATGPAARCLESLSSSAKGTGHINVIPDLDGKYRRVPAYITFDAQTYPFLALKLACDYLGIPDKDIEIAPGAHVRLGGPSAPAEIPLDQNSLMLVNFSGPWADTFRHYSYVDILQSYLARLNGETPNMDLASLKDKICIIGLTAVGTVDLHPNPFDSLYPAVGLHAEVFNSIINNSFARRASGRINLSILVVLSLIVSVLVLSTKPLRGLFILFSVISVYVLLCILVFNHFGLWIDILYPTLVVVLLHLSLTLYKYISEWKRRLLMENELDIAKKIQDSFLPKSMPELEGVEVSACMFTARQVGGDLYDFVSFGEGRFGIMAGDVSGKGVPAALFMAMVVGAFRSFAVSGAKPEEVLASLNAKLVKESASNLFVTVFYMIFDMQKKSVMYGNGGHLPVLHLRRSGAAQFLDVKEGAPLGLMDGEYTGGGSSFGTGDTFIFYTDGITEAMNARSDMYGKERLQAVAEKNRSLGAAKLAAAIEKDVRRFEPKQTQHDDMTIIVVKII